MARAPSRNKALTLSGTAAMQVGRAGSTLSNDKISGITTVTYGGTLLITNVGANALQAGDSFQLFQATNRSGSFGTITLPSPGAGLVWVTSSLASNGRISVAAQGALEDPYLAWAAVHGIEGSDGDPDGDGVANLLEFYLDGNPLAADGSILPVATLNATHLVLTFQRRDDAEGDPGAEVVRWRSHLDDWTEFVLGASSSGPDANGVFVEVTENGELPDDITISIPRVLGSGGKLFASLKVTE
jgi:hypothetical protein